MLAIRMQRTGRKGHAMFRVVVQDARRTPTSGKIVARLGSYDPHAKAVTLDKEKASFYLEHGAQPSGRVALLLKKEGVKLPDWVSLPDKRESKVRNPEKRRSTRPNEPTEEAPAETESTKAPAEETPETPETEAEAPAEEPKAEESAETSDVTKPAEPSETAEPTEEPATEDKPSEETDEAENKPEDSEASEAKEAEKSDSEKA